MLTLMLTMAIPEAADGITLTGLSIGGGVVSAIVAPIILYLKSKTVHKVQLEKDMNERFVSKEDHKKDIDAINKRIDDFGPIFNRMFRKLSDIDSKAEERAEKLHRRLDPIIEKVSAHTAALEILKGFKRELNDD